MTRQEAEGGQPMTKQKPKRRRVWFVANRDVFTEDGKLLTLRGPYNHEETAGAVRKEMENSYPDKTWNLWIVWEWEVAESEEAMTKVKQIDYDDHDANMYGVKPCPTCGDTHRWPTQPSHPKTPNSIVCDRCGHVEPLEKKL